MGCINCMSHYVHADVSQGRASEAPVIRRLFSTSPRDPRYHMLSHLSAKFDHNAKRTNHEPRAAFFVNRYTRSLTIMYATNGLEDVLGVSSEELKGRSLYYCIQENCLQDAVRCLENAKANDSIAYLRFWFRDPTQDDENEQDDWHDTRMDVDSSEESGIGQSESDDTDMGGVDVGKSGHSNSPRHHPAPALDIRSQSSGESQAVSSASSVEPIDSRGHPLQSMTHPDSRASSGDSNPYTHEAVFGEPPEQDSSASSLSTSPTGNGHPNGRRRRRHDRPPIDLEAVVSCTSDGMVVCLRRARSAPMTMNDLEQPPQPVYANGLFAVPWATTPILPPISQRPQYVHSNGLGQSSADVSSNATAGPDFMNSIRDIAVFAWALTGINGSIADYGAGKPRGEAQPAAGLPIWRPEALQHRTHGSHHESLDPGPQMAAPAENALLTNGNSEIGEDMNESLGGATNTGPKPNFSMPFKGNQKQQSPSRINGENNYL